MNWQQVVFIALWAFGASEMMDANLFDGEHEMRSTTGLGRVNGTRDPARFEILDTDENY